jgi:soluble lytic murein transglycosylase-like protein
MTMTPAELEAQEPTLELLNNEVASRLSRQSDSLAKIDTKAVFLIGFAATAAQFLATHRHHDVLAYCAFAAYAVTLLTGVRTIRVAEHKDLEPRPMIAAHVALPKSHALAALTASRASIFEKNEERHEKKARYWAGSLWSLVLGLGLSTVSLLLHT